MAILSAMVASLSTYYPDDQDLDLNIVRLLAKAKTIAAFSHKKSIGQPFMYPINHLSYTENFLHMMFAVPAEPYQVSPAVDHALNLLLILHADHEQNCSTSTVRMVGSSGANLFASIAAGICALWGPLHGGANQAVIEMLEQIQRDGGGLQKYVDLAKRKDSGFKLMGFGHRVYKNFDPRSRILKKAADDVLAELGVSDPLLDLARRLEEVALKDEYFVERKLYPNVDFYSGIIYRAMGIPTNMFTVMFALGRLPGLDRPLARDARRGRPHQPPAPDLHRRDRAPLGAGRAALARLFGRSSPGVRLLSCGGRPRPERRCRGGGGARRACRDAASRAAARLAASAPSGCAASGARSGWRSRAARGRSPETARPAGSAGRSRRSRAAPAANRARAGSRAARTAAAAVGSGGGGPRDSRIFMARRRQPAKVGPVIPRPADDASHPPRGGLTNRTRSVQNPREQLRHCLK